MKKASEYRLHAAECRAIAAQMDSADQRRQMLEMAEHWEKLAADRLDLVEKHPELAQDNDPVEGRSWNDKRPEASNGRA